MLKQSYGDPQDEELESNNYLTCQDREPATLEEDPTAPVSLLTAT